MGETRVGRRPDGCRAGGRSGASRLLLLVVVLPLAACASPRGSAAECESQFESEVSAGPTFTPYHVRPELRDEDGFRRTLARKAGDAGLELEGAAGEIWVLVAAEGCVIRTLLEESTGSRALDRLILRHWLDARYSPGLNRRGEEHPVDVWIVEPVPE